jgi:hypothetical protein
MCNKDDHVKSSHLIKKIFLNVKSIKIIITLLNVSPLALIINKKTWIWKLGLISLMWVWYGSCFCIKGLINPTKFNHLGTCGYHGGNNGPHLKFGHGEFDCPLDL